MTDTPPSPSPTLLEEVRRVLRLQHSSIHTERSYVEWIRRFTRFHQMRSRADLFPAEPKIEAFLTDLALHGNVAAATQNQVMHALVFVYKRVLHQALEDRIDAVRADKKVTVPVVMTRNEVTAVLSLLEGTPQLVAKLLYGSGLRMMEAVRLRVKDIDVAMKQLTVRSGKGDKDRFTTFPAGWPGCPESLGRSRHLICLLSWLPEAGHCALGIGVPTPQVAARSFAGTRPRDAFGVGERLATIRRQLRRTPPYSALYSRS